MGSSTSSSSTSTSSSTSKKFHYLHDISLSSIDIILIKSSWHHDLQITKIIKKIIIIIMTSQSMPPRSTVFLPWQPLPFPRPQHWPLLLQGPHHQRTHNHQHFNIVISLIWLIKWAGWLDGNLLRWKQWISRSIWLLSGCPPHHRRQFHHHHHHHH